MQRSHSPVETRMQLRTFAAAALLLLSTTTTVLANLALPLRLKSLRGHEAAI